MHKLESIINTNFENRSQITKTSVSHELKESIRKVIAQLDNGSIRVAEKIDGEWVVNEWIKKAILLSFLTEESKTIQGNGTNYYDKIPLKFNNMTDSDFEKIGARVVPPAHARYGSYISHGVVLMPSYVNIGAYIDSGSMIDTWVTIGSCAQIGKNVHISGGVGIGGVLEPLQARPTIIGDNCFIGARSEIVEGVIIDDGAVISMGVYIGQSTRIFNRDTGEISYGYIPSNSVVVSGNLPSKDGTYSLYCAVIVKQVDNKTRTKIGINKLLRDI